MQDTPLALEVSGLTKDYGSFILKDVSFSLPHGYIMGFIGQNGAGKTTTIKCIMNLVRPNSGTVKVFGIDASREPVKVRHMVGYVGEEQPFYEQMTVGATAWFVSRFRPNWDDDPFKRLCRKYRVPLDKKVKDLSKGTRVKFALSLALAHKPRLLILDEPMSGLDPVVRREVVEELLDLIQDEARSVLLSSHIVEDLERVADYIALIHSGRLLFALEKDEVLANWKRLTVPRELAPRIERYAFGAGEHSVTPVTLPETPAAAHARRETVTVVVDRFRELLRELPGLENRSDVQIESIGLEEIMLVVAKLGDTEESRSR